MIHLYEMAEQRAAEQRANNENTRAIKHIPFDVKYEVRKFPTGLFKIIELTQKAEDTYIIPKYQRDLKWTLEDNQNLIYSLMIGSPIGEFIFVKETVENTKAYCHTWTVIDGQQRINALREFVQNKYPDKDNRYYKDYSYREMVYLFEDFDNFSAVYIEDLTEIEQVEIYLSKNIGGVVHTTEEINKAQNYLDYLNSIQK